MREEICVKGFLEVIQLSRKCEDRSMISDLCVCVLTAQTSCWIMVVGGNHWYIM